MLESGQQFAHFKIIKKLGEGGMGEVYLAEDSKLNRKVALKVLLEEVFDSPDRQERFRREADSLTRLKHPNIVSFYEWGKDAETPFLIMEYVKGRSLDQVLDAQPDRRLPIAEGLWILRQIGPALHFAHKNQVCMFLSLNNNRSNRLLLISDRNTDSDRKARHTDTSIYHTSCGK